MIPFNPITKSTQADDVVSVNPKRSFLAELRQVQKTIELRACQDIRFAQPILTLNGIGIIYPNSITTIQGQKGVHKSRLTENFSAAFLCRDPNEDFIGFRVTPLNHFHLVYVDSERNQNDQFPYAVQRIKQRAGFEKDSLPLNLEAVSLISVDRAERFEAIAQYLEDVRKQHPGELIIVILDVITDCTGSFNDPKESMKLLDHLNMTINRENVAFICVIHENPNNFGEGKARGHLGTELVNKSTSVISIGYEKGPNGVATDLLAVKFLHTRNTKKPEPHYLRYSEEAKGLVVADTGFIKEEKGKKVEKAKLPELKDWLTENMDGEVSKADLVAQLQVYFGCTGKTVETRLKELTDDENGFLIADKRGKHLYYSLAKP